MNALRFLAYLIKHKIYYAIMKVRFFPHVSWKEVWLHDMDKMSSLGALEYYGEAKALGEDWGIAHRVTQKHHWEYWQEPYSHPNPIPFFWQEAMICDWFAASWAHTGNWRNVFNWYWENRPDMEIESKTKRLIDAEMAIMEAVWKS